MITCQCCGVKFPVNPIEREWRQYCKDCFREKGNKNYDIVIDGINSKGYPYYKCIPKCVEYLFIDDDTI
jgi:hypothetical protein